MTPLASAEAICCALFFAYLAWLPLPFGSASDNAQTLLIVPALLLCAASMTIRLLIPATHRQSRATKFWLTAGLLFAASIASELVPLPAALLRAISPEGARVRAGADAIARLAGEVTVGWHPSTVDASDTLLQLLRVLAYLATFTNALLLIRSGARRLALAGLLVGMATFESLYAIREASLQRYAIWGWKNTLMFGRASGTFVNPNHFAHYAAIILPLAVFLSALAWQEASPPGAPFGRRMASLIEKRMLLFTVGVLGALGCISSILVAQSRGAVLAVVAGFALVSVLTMSHRKATLRVLAGGVLVIVCFASAVLVLGQSGMAGRLNGDQTAGIGGRRAPILAALRLWRLFPLVGSGANTFENVVLEVEPSGEILYNHAHDDYAEIAATMGAAGLVAGLPFLLAGFSWMSRDNRQWSRRRWRRQAFQTAALASVAIAMVHALVDFNFFIPANPATLAAIAGAAAGASARRRVRSPDQDPFAPAHSGAEGDVVTTS